MATTADIKNGLCIEWNNDIFQIIEFQHVKPGKGAAFVRTKLKSLTTGKVLDNTFNSGVKINPVRIEHRPHQFLYKDESGYVFMNNESFDQITIQDDLIAGKEFLKEGQEVQIMVQADNETPLSVELPPFVELKIIYSEPGLRGDTATNTLKPATLETGAIVNVPLFVDTDEFIKVDTRTGSYVERVKK
jgi:elongation factor P